MANPYLNLGTQQPVYNNPFYTGAQGTFGNNPFASFFSSLGQQPWTIKKVKGEQGANALQMPPRSEVLAIDEDDPIIWLIQTDDSCVKTLHPIQIIVPEDPKQKAMDSLEERVRKLEEMFKHGQSDIIDVAYTE